MITKGQIRSINSAGTRCIVRMPLFETASSALPVEAEAVINITPGMYNNLFINDIVLIAFEENALEKPVILGKLFTGSGKESTTSGGMGILDTLLVRNKATIPSSTLFAYPENLQKSYENFNTPKKLADYIKWLEALIKKFLLQLETNFTCFKNWVQWQLRPENVEIDDGDLDDASSVINEPFLYQAEGEECKVCGKNCTKSKTRSYVSLELNKEYPNS